MTAPKNTKDAAIVSRWPYGRRNYLLFLSGVATIAVGYGVMASGEVESFRSVTLAPVLLLIGYLVLVPAALVMGNGKTTTQVKPGANPQRDRSSAG